MKFRISESPVSAESYTTSLGEKQVPYDKLVAEIKTAIQTAPAKDLEKLCVKVVDHDQWWAYMTPAWMSKNVKFIESLAASYAETFKVMGGLVKTLSPADVGQKSQKLTDVRGKIKECVASSYATIKIGSDSFFVPKKFFSSVVAVKGELEKELNYDYDESTPSKTGFKASKETLVTLLEYTGQIVAATDKAMATLVAACGGLSTIANLAKASGTKINAERATSPYDKVALALSTISNDLANCIYDMYDQTERYFSAISMVDELVVWMYKALVQKD